MAWSRGFFRLWIALAAIWIAATVFLLGKSEFKGLWQPGVKLQVTYDGGTSAVLDSALPIEDIRRQIIEDIKADARATALKSGSEDSAKQIREASESADELLKAIADKASERQEHLRTALFFTLFPPIIALFLGLLTTWVARGFKPNLTQPTRPN